MNVDLKAGNIFTAKVFKQRNLSGDNDL